MGWRPQARLEAEHKAGSRIIMMYKISKIYELGCQILTALFK